MTMRNQYRTPRSDGQLTRGGSGFSQISPNVVDSGDKCDSLSDTCVRATLVAHGLELGSARVEARMGLTFPDDVDPG